MTDVKSPDGRHPDLAQPTAVSTGAPPLARRLLARPLRAEELPIVEASLNDLLAHYQAHADDARLLLGFGDTQADAKMEAPTLAAWTMLTNELMNLDEVLNK